MRFLIRPVITRPEMTKKMSTPGDLATGWLSRVIEDDEQNRQAAQGLNVDSCRRFRGR